MDLLIITLFRILANAFSDEYKQEKPVKLTRRDVHISTERKKIQFIIIVMNFD